MRPDQPCPLLIITGTHRDEATRAIRELIDPGTCAILPLPVTQNQMGEMALFNSAHFGSLIWPTPLVDVLRLVLLFRSLI